MSSLDSETDRIVRQSGNGKRQLRATFKPYIFCDADSAVISKVVLVITQRLGG